MEPITGYDDSGHGERRSKALWLLVGAACLVVSLIAALAVVVLRGNAGQGKQAASVGAGNRIEQRLWDLTVKAAGYAGTTVKAAQPVQTTESDAEWAVMNATSTSAGDGPAWVIQATGYGDFVCDACGRAGQGKIQSIHSRYMVLMVHAGHMDGSYGGGF